jgi:hypothetical protein
MFWTLKLSFDVDNLASLAQRLLWQLFWKIGRIFVKSSGHPDLIGVVILSLQMLQFVKVRLHYGDYRSKLVHFESQKNIFYV